MAYIKCPVVNKKESVYTKSFSHTWSNGTSHAVGFNVNLSSIPVYSKISMKNIHFADVVGTYDKSYAMQSATANFTEFSRITGEYNSYTGILSITYHGVARLFPGKVQGTVIIM